MLQFSIPSREEGGTGGSSVAVSSSRYGESNVTANSNGGLLLSILRARASELSKPVTSFSGVLYPPLGYLNLASSSDLLTPHNYPSAGLSPFNPSNGAVYPATAATLPNVSFPVGHGGYLAQLRLGQVASLVADPGATPDATERHAVYQAGLEAAHELRQSALASATVARQNKAAAELWGWLQRYRPGVSPATCSDEDLAAYVMKGWLPNHHSRASADVPAGPSALKSHLSSLSGFFNRIDRGGPYNSSTSRGNPCESSIIEDLRTAYQREQVQAGYAEVSAVPMTEAKYRALAFYLWATYSAATTAIERLVALRDHLCVLLLWQTAVRGHDLGKLGTGDFVNPDNTALPYQGFPLLPPWQWGSYLGPILCFCERGTKTHKLARAPPIFLMPDVAEPRLSIPRVLALYMALCSAADAPPGSAVTDLLFRPLAPDGKGFKEAPLSSSTMGARLRLHLVAAGLYSGETVHSFRRGSLQNAQAVGLPQSSLFDLGQLRTPSVLERYLDSSRHLGRDVRARVE